MTPELYHIFLKTVVLFSRPLESYFGDPLKVVSCVMKEVMLQQTINDGDYKVLVSYSHVLENNYNRLKSLELEHEMSNTSAMSSMVRKFPRLIGEKWHEHLSLQVSSVKARSFAEFIVWLASQREREMWERMAASEIGEGKDDRSRNKGVFLERQEMGEGNVTGVELKVTFNGSVQRRNLMR